LADERPEAAALSGEERWMPVCGLSRLISQTIVCVRVTGVDLILMERRTRGRLRTDLPA
jgi:3-phenylpropionate/trans-cinnamate dioxygenase ferredoxin component